MEIASEYHAENPNRNPEGGRTEAEFDLLLSKDGNSDSYRLTIRSKVVIDFQEYKSSLPGYTADPVFQANWAREFKNVVEKKWGGFRLSVKGKESTYIRFVVECILQTPETKTSDYHIWVWIHPKFSFAPSSQPSFYRGMVWNLRPVDTSPGGNCAHEFGHMIGITHTNDQQGERLMYGNDSVPKDETSPMIKNGTGYVYPDADLKFHADWTKQKLTDKKILSGSAELKFNETRRK
jgi:hypothetical protein